MPLRQTVKYFLCNLLILGQFAPTKIELEAANTAFFLPRPINITPHSKKRQFE